jgi:hypothetical protein
MKPRMLDNKLQENATPSHPEKPQAAQVAQATPSNAGPKGLSMEELSASVDVSNGRCTIYKSWRLASNGEWAALREQAIQNLIANKAIDPNKNYRPTDIMHECCGKTYQGLLDEEMNWMENNEYDLAQSELNCSVSGSLYAISSFDEGTRNYPNDTKRTFYGYERLTKRVERPKFDNGKSPTDNVSQVLSYAQLQSDYINVYCENGEIFSDNPRGGRSVLTLFREFVPTALDDTDPHLLTLIEYDKEVYANPIKAGGYVIDEKDFEILLFNVQSQEEYREIIDKFTKPIAHYVAGIYEMSAD